MRFSKIATFVVGATVLAGCGSDDGSPTGASQTRSILGDTQPEAGTTVADILANPAGFEGTQVQLPGVTTSEIGPGSFLFADNTGEIPVDFPGGVSVPPLNTQIELTGLVTNGPRIGAISWVQAPALTCEQIIEVRARFSDPGYVAGNVVGFFLSYRGVPAGDKTLEITWDEGNPSGAVDSFDLGMGTPRDDGLFDLEGVVSHEYPDITTTVTKSVRANLRINGRDGGCARVRDVTVSKGSGPGFAAGGALRVTLNDPVPSGGFFSVSAFVTNPTGNTGDAHLVFSTPDGSSIRTMGSGCAIKNDAVVECVIQNIGGGQEKSEFVQYNAPDVSRPTEIYGSVTFVGRDVSPVAQYVTTIEP